MPHLKRLNLFTKSLKNQQLNATTNPDAGIILQLKNGNQQAMATVLDKYGDALYGAIYQIVRSEDIAKDLMQDACIKIWNNIKSYDEQKGRLFTWLLRVCRNTAIDKARTSKFKAVARAQTIEDTVSNSLVHSEEMTIQDSGLQQVISRLDEKYQQVINLIYLQGYTQQEAAKALDIPLGTVKSRVKISIRELRSLLKENPLLIFVIISLLIGSIQ